MSIFRPCIDLHNGRVKPIVGGIQHDVGAGPLENLVSDHPAYRFAEKFSLSNSPSAISSS